MVRPQPQRASVIPQHQIVEHEIVPQPQAVRRVAHHRAYVKARQPRTYERTQQSQTIGRMQQLQAIRRAQRPQAFGNVPQPLASRRAPQPLAFRRAPQPPQFEGFLPFGEVPQLLPLGRAPQPQAFRRSPRPQSTRRITRALILSLSVCYHARLQDRTGYEKGVSKQFVNPLSLPGGDKQFRDEIRWLVLSLVASKCLISISVLGAKRFSWII